jgi:hypothetical protein
MKLEEKLTQLMTCSNLERVFENAKEYGIPDVFLSDKPTKKFMIYDPKGKWVHFGAMGMEDYTHHQDEKRRQNYLNRSGAIKGNWKNNKYSPNNLARNLLWN